MIRLVQGVLGVGVGIDYELCAVSSDLQSF